MLESHFLINICELPVQTLDAKSLPLQYSFCVAGCDAFPDAGKENHLLDLMIEGTLLFFCSSVHLIVGAHIVLLGCPSLCAYMHACLAEAFSKQLAVNFYLMAEVALFSK